MSYRKKHIKSKIHRIKPKKSIFKKLWFWAIILFIGIILYGFYLIFFYSGLQLKNIVISGNNKIKTEDIKNVVLQYSNIKLLDFAKVKIVSGSIFLINENKISENILARFPDVERILTNKKFPQTLIVKVIERAPVGVFCNTENICFQIDGDGIIFDQINAMPNDQFIVSQGDDSIQLFAGEKVVEPNIMSAIIKIKQNLKDNFQIDLKKATITSPVRLSVTTSQDWNMYFDVSANSDVDSQLTKLNLLFNRELTADEKSNLRYIDLRPKDRAIVCDNKICGG